MLHQWCEKGETTQHHPLTTKSRDGDIFMKIKLQKIELEQEVKDKFDALFKRKNMEITYYNGYITKFDKCNVESISPHKILISNNEKNLLIMHYADYLETDGLYFIDGEKESFNITNLKEYVKNYF